MSFPSAYEALKQNDELVGSYAVESFPSAYEALKQFCASVLIVSEIVVPVRLRGIETARAG